MPLLLLLGLTPLMLLPLLQLNVVLVKQPGFFFPGYERCRNGLKTVAA
jgi:hypothetical protein